MINVGDYVTRKSHGNDIVFKVIDIKNNIYYLKGIDIRLLADSTSDDLIKCEDDKSRKDDSYALDALNSMPLNRDNYFYIPGKVLHIDGDEEYLKRCIDYYKKAKVPVYGKCVDEEITYKGIEKLLEEIKPDILVITGHDSYNKSTGKYKNSDKFIMAVRNARKYEKSSENLVIIAGACQSDYISLIKAGSTFASSPKKINIHALDPAIIAVNISYTNKNTEISLKDLLSKTMCGSDGIGGIKSKGMMYEGYPRGDA